jgi:hypothetical protein
MTPAMMARYIVLALRILPQARLMRSRRSPSSARFVVPCRGFSISPLPDWRDGRLRPTNAHRSIPGREPISTSLLEPVTPVHTIQQLRHAIRAISTTNGIRLHNKPRHLRRFLIFAAAVEPLTYPSVTPSRADVHEILDDPMTTRAAPTGIH